MHLALHVPFKTKTMPCISIKMHIALAMVYVFFYMCLASIMVCIIFKMQLVFHVPFDSLAIVYVFVKIHLALTMAYFPLARMCLGAIMVTCTTTSVTNA